MTRASGSRPFRVRDLLVGAVPGLRDRMFEEAIRSDWAQVAGPELARRSRPGELRGGVLGVLVDNSAWLHEMTLRSSELLAGLRARHGVLVTSLRFTLGALPAPRPTATPQRPPVAGDLSPEEARSVDTIAAPLADPALAASVRRLVTKDFITRRRRAASFARREHI